MTAKEFEKFYNDLHLPLAMYALRLTGDYGESEDIVNGIFEALWMKYEQDEPPENAKFYAYKAVRNRAVNYLNRQGRETGLDPRTNDMAEEEIDTSERDARLWRAIGRLPEKCREVFLMAKRDGMSYAEIAEETGTSVRTVENHVAKAMRRLRDAYGLDPASSSHMSCFFLPFL